MSSLAATDTLPLTPPAPARAGWLRYALNVAAFAAALLAGAWALRSAQPFPDVPAVGPKYRFYAQHKDEFDVLVAGSSRLFHQVIPAEFEQAVEAATGQRVHLYNAAYDGLWPPENFYFTRQLLALGAPRLKWVIFEAMDAQTELDDPTQQTKRMAYWHDWPHTRMALDSIHDSRLPAATRERYAKAHWQLFFQHIFSLGKGASTAARWLEKPAEPRTLKWMSAQGYESIGEKGLEGEKRTKYLAAVERLEMNHAPVTPRPAYAAALAELSAEIRAHGAQPIYVVTQTLKQFEIWDAIPSAADYYAFTDPKEYPALYDPALHFDDWHLNERGAHAFTQALAARFAETLRRQGTK